MIGTIFQISFMRLWNNKQELLLALVVPILFFSIFAMIFGRGVTNGTTAMEVAIVDDDRSPLTKRVVQLLKEQAAIQIATGILQTNRQWSLERLTKAAMRETGADVVIHLPRGMEHNLQTRAEVSIQLLSEGSNPVGRQVVSSMLSQVVALAAARDERPGPLTGEVGRLVSTAQLTRLPPTGAETRPSAGRSRGPTSERGTLDLVSFTATDVFAADKHDPKIAMYAAGIAVMFLLFSATGAGGTLLEEYEAGTLDRLLSSRLSVTELLGGKWLYITALGCVQLTVMFMWAEIAFGVDLRGHIPGFAAMTVCTAAATASLALCLAVFCRSRAQLNGISIVLILTMSALGGSMVPRYIMSEQMQRWGQFTFNAWALDGYKKVFWHDLPLTAMETEIKVLLMMAVALAGMARLFADRWAAN